MPKSRQPDDFPPQAGEELPDLSMRELDKEVGLEHNSGGDKPEQQSIFSKRSGIQDPLIRPEPRPESRPEEPTEANAAEEVENEAAKQDTSAVAVETEDEEEDQPERRPRRGKANPRLVKSKRHLDRARRRQKNYLQQRREKKKLRVFYHRIRIIFKLCFAVLWCVLLWEVVHSPLWLLDKPRFIVKDAHLIQAEQLAPWVQQQVGKPLYTINTGKLARKIKHQFEIASSVAVRRQLFPSRLEILVQEKQPWAEIYAVDPFPNPDKNETKPTSPDAKTETHGAAQPAKTKSGPVPYGLIVASGIIPLAQYHYQPGMFGPTPLEKLIVTPKTVFSLQYLHRLEEIIWQARQIKGLHLQSVDVRNPMRIIFNFQELPVLLGRLNGSASERLGRLVPLIPKIMEYHEGMSAVDLQWEEQVTFHQKPNAKLDIPKPEQTQG